MYVCMYVCMYICVYAYTPHSELRFLGAWRRGRITAGAGTRWHTTQEALKAACSTRPARAQGARTPRSPRGVSSAASQERADPVLVLAESGPAPMDLGLSGEARFRAGRRNPRRSRVSVRRDRPHAALTASAAPPGGCVQTRRAVARTEPPDGTPGDRAGAAGRQAAGREGEAAPAQEGKGGVLPAALGAPACCGGPRAGMRRRTLTTRRTDAGARRRRRLHWQPCRARRRQTCCRAACRQNLPPPSWRTLASAAVRSTPSSRG
jgi:hypothetical protein